MSNNSRIINFYRGAGKDDAGRTFDEVLALSHDQLEQKCDWVQWVFSLPEPSRAHPSSPVATREDLEQFRQSAELQAKVGRALTVTVRFLLRGHWLHPDDHNHLRITRIIRFLTLTGSHVAAHAVYALCSGLMVEAGLEDADALWYWAEALEPEPAFLKE